MKVTTTRSRAPVPKIAAPVRDSRLDSYPREVDDGRSTMSTTAKKTVECMTLVDLPGILGRDPTVRVYCFRGQHARSYARFHRRQQSLRSKRWAS